MTRQEPLLAETTAAASPKQNGQGGVTTDDDSEAIHVLVGYGASHEGYYSLLPRNTRGNHDDDSIDLPPPPLRGRIDPKTWKRFRGHLWNISLSGMLQSDAQTIGWSGVWAGRLGPIWFIMWFLARGLDYDDAIFLAVYTSLSVLLMVLVLHSRCVAEPRNKVAHYQRVLDKMQPTFARQGYSVHLGGPFWDYGIYVMCERQYYVTFTPLLHDEEHPFQRTNDDNNVNQEDEQLGPFHPPDWYPLEGKWIKTNASAHNHPHPLFAFFQYWYGETSLVWTFTGTRSPETFVWEKQAQMRFLYVCPRTVRTTSRVVSTASSNHSPNTNGSEAQFWNVVEAVPTKPQSRIQQALRESTCLRPLFIANNNNDYNSNAAADDDGASYYLQGEQCVWRVTRQTLTQYTFTFLEDMPTHQDIIHRGALLQMNNDGMEGSIDEDCLVWQFERRQ